MLMSLKSIYSTAREWLRLVWQIASHSSNF